MIADGTFKVCPKEFLQLYVLHRKIFSKVYPLVYILLKTKKENDYSRAFNIIFEKQDLTFPEYIIIDFEFAAYIAFKKAIKSMIYFFLFHFGQCIFRKLQKYCLAKEFLHTTEFRFFVICITSLAFVPSEFVEAEYQKILKTRHYSKT